MRCHAVSDLIFPFNDSGLSRRRIVGFHAPFGKGRKDAQDNLSPDCDLFKVNRRTSVSSLNSTHRLIALYVGASDLQKKVYVLQAQFR